VNAYVNPANAITFARFFTLPPFVHFLDTAQYQWATLMVIICGVLDLFDGAVARAFRCSSAFGEVFDAIADAACYGFFLIVLILYQRLPLPAAAAIVGMGGINTVFRAIYARRVGRATNYRSFAMERVVAYVAYLVGLAVAGYQVAYFAWSGVAVMAVVLVHDAKRMLIDPVPQ
jgi:phosphatidylglycerophosphate synthase